MINVIGANHLYEKNNNQCNMYLSEHNVLFVGRKTPNKFTLSWIKTKGQTIGKHKACQSNINNIEHGLTQVPCYGVPCHVSLSFKLTY